jgi:hypothetical protein
MRAAISIAAIGGPGVECSQTKQSPGPPDETVRANHTRKARDNWRDAFGRGTAATVVAGRVAERRNAERKTDLDRGEAEGRQQRAEEEKVVPLAHAVVEPLAAVVEPWRSF